MKEIRTRMAPSPTGKLHLGTSYATLWPYIFARKNNGKFILRIEDTDRERSTKEFEENIISGLTWLGFKWDEGPLHQMDRLELYQQAIVELLDNKKAYLCFCTKEELDLERKIQIEKHLPQIYSGKCRNLSKKEVEDKKNQGMDYVVRYKLPEDRGVVGYEDLIHGKIQFESKLLGDMVIMRKNGIPLYNFAVVVDDIDMKISHVIRGDDHISNTPKQILLWEAFKKELPAFAHYPVILNQDRSGKLSKRTGSTSLEDYRKDGYLPEALINYLVLLGWTPPGEKEILSIEEIINLFDISDMNKAPAAWNEAKLDWINGEYIRKSQNSKLKNQILEYLKEISGGVGTEHPNEEELETVIPLIKERIKKLSDIIPLTDFLWRKPEYDTDFFNKLKIENIKNVLEKIEEKLRGLKKPWESEEFEKIFRDLAKELDIKDRDIFQLLRVVISGQLVSPPLFESIKILGEDETLERAKYVSETYPDFPYQKPKEDRF